MKTTTTLLAALLLAGVSRAALAQEQGHDRNADRPQFQDHADHRGGEHRGSPPGSAPAPAPQSAPMAPQGGHARFGAPPPPSAGPAPAPTAPAVAAPPQGAPRGERSGERHWDRGGDRSNFTPGGAATGDRHWERPVAPREVTPPVNTTPAPGWNRDRDGRAGDGARLGQSGRDDRNRDQWDRDHGRWDQGRNGDHDRGDRGNGERGRWDQGRNGDNDRWDHNGDRGRDHRGLPPNWRHWQRGQTPNVYSASHRYHVGPYRPPYGWYVRAWGYGDILPSGWYGSNFWIDDFYDYDLPWPPPGMHWVRVGDDAFLVDDYSGRIVQVIRDMFW